jgi:hypothetical protein
VSRGINQILTPHRSAQSKGPTIDASIDSQYVDQLHGVAMS